jgi:hypothetical protein
MKTLLIVGVLAVTLSSCSGSQSPIVEDSMPPSASKVLSAADCQPLVFPSTEPQGSEEDYEAIQGITSATLDLFVDASEKDATACATRMGLAVRILSRDGEQFMVTMDYSPKRVNFAVERDIVTAATVG